MLSNIQEARRADTSRLAKYSIISTAVSVVTTTDDSAIQNALELKREGESALD
jgi:hypothetical protein